MKHCFVILLLLCTSVFAIQAKAQTGSKIAYYNFDLLLTKMPEFKTAADSTVACCAKSAEIITNMNNEIQRLTDEITSKDWSPEERDTQEKKLADLRKEIEDYKKVFDAEFEVCKAKFLGPVLEKIKLAENKLAKENGYTEVLDTSEATGAVVFPEGSVDIFNAMCKELGIPIPKKK